MEVPIIVALITTCAAIIAPVFQALITSRHQYKMKSMELFFEAKSNAYREYLEFTQDTTKLASQDSLEQLMRLFSVTYLFASDKVQSSLVTHSMTVISKIRGSLEDPRILNIALAGLLAAMQEDLRRPDTGRGLSRQESDWLRNTEILRDILVRAPEDSSQSKTEEGRNNPPA